MITVRRYDPKSAEEYQAIVDVYNQAWPEDQNTVTEWQHRDELWPESHLRQRFVVAVADRIIAECTLMEPHWPHVPGNYLYSYSVLPGYERTMYEGSIVDDAVYAFVVDSLGDRAVRTLTTYTRQDKTDRINWLQSHGFRETMREPVSQLNVPAFDATRFDSVCKRVAASDIQIRSLVEMRHIDADWLQKIYDLWMELEADVPATNPFTPQPIEQFQGNFSSPNFLADGWFIAVDNADGAAGPYVGITTLGASQADEGKLYTWLTGVRRPYRRRGIALALKVHAIKFAQQRGTQVIETDNEENNPMFQINLKLGFELLPAWLEFEKTLT